MSMERDAIRAINAINEVLRAHNGELLQTRLAAAISWAQCDLGRFTDFLREHGDMFGIDNERGAGNNIVFQRRRIVSPEPAVPVSPRGNTDDLYRPFDGIDGFNNNETRLRNLKNHQKKTLLNQYIVAALAGESDARDVFDRAYAKCTRMTISVGHVVDHPDVTKSLLTELLTKSIAEDIDCRLFVFKRATFGIFLDVAVTICCNDTVCEAAMKSLTDALMAGEIHLKNKHLSLYQVGYGPTHEAVVLTIKDLLMRRQQELRDRLAAEPISPIPAAVEPPADPIAVNVLTNVLANMTVSVQQSVPAVNELPTAAGVWPLEYAFEGPHKRIYNPDIPTNLSEFIGHATQNMVAKEQLLRERCAAMRLLPLDESRGLRYIMDGKCEWIVNETFLLGRGSEASIYMGLWSDPNAPERESSLVAIKMSNDGMNPFNSQERDHLMNLKRSAGIAQYHTSFDVDLGIVKLFILVIDIGLVSLRDLIITHRVKLTAEEKFKLTKALCVAVNDLHIEFNVVHRDLRPENVLLMPDGTMNITDFGLSRTAKVEGTCKFTMQLNTVMQPYEVQKEYEGAAKEKAPIPVTHKGDVFMLGCVLAYIHQGRDPFTDNRQIREKQAPDLDPELEKAQPWLFHLIRSMLNHDMNQRPSCGYVLKHPYFMGHTANFDACLIRGIEFTVVADFKPKDDHAFRALEAVLAPIEQRLHSDATKWHQALPSALFGLYPLPFTDPRFPLKFVSEVAPQARDHPLPLLAQLLRWHRNMINHFTEEIQTHLRRTKGDSSFYDTGGEFFTTHPNICWLLPMVWTLTFRSIARIEERRVTLIKENEKRIEQFQRELQTVADDRAMTARVLDWNR